ncbi:zinc finger MYM-type protein 1-like [Tachysurus ichikawai]
MSKRPKPSGAQGRKKRREEEEKREKDRYALLKYLNPIPANPGPPVADISISAPPSDSAASTSLPSTSAPPSDSASVYEKAAPLDPADWPSILNEKPTLFKLFSASTHRWYILLKHVKTTLTSWSETRWESRIDSIQAVRYQAGQVREALLEVRETNQDPVVKVEAQSLAEEIGSYRFSICTVIWYDILNKIQNVSKQMQSPSMQLDVAVDMLKKTRDSLDGYRNTGFSSAQATAKEMCEEMNVEAVIKQKRLRTTKRHFGYEAPDESIGDALKKLETSFFNVVVDTALSSLDTRSQTLGEVNDKFGVLLNFPNMSKEELLEHCKTLSTALSHNGQPDIDCRELVLEIQNFPHLPSKNMTNIELLTFLHEKKLMEIYPNMWVALRISATLPVRVAAAERSFSKLKLIKNYLRSRMAQERLSGLSVISINHVVSQQLSYDDIIDDFAARKARRGHQMKSCLGQQIGQGRPWEHGPRARTTRADHNAKTTTLRPQRSCDSHQVIPHITIVMNLIDTE